MLYLLYLRSGYIRKFPLTKKTIIIGRSSENDLTLDESLVSQKHAKINVFKNHIMVEDLDSTNGIFIGTTKIHRAKIELNKYFRIGYVNIFLKEGNVQDLVVSKKVPPVLSKISKMFTTKGDKTKEAINLLYTEQLIEMLQIGSKMEDFGDIFKFGKELFDQVLEKGSLVLITSENNNNIIESKWNYKEEYYPLIFKILQLGDILQKTHINEKIADSFSFCSFPFVSSVRKMLLIYLLKNMTIVFIISFP